MATRDMWTYGDETIGDVDLTGFKVEAGDGSIGKVDEASYEVGASFIVVDTGPWIFGRKVMLPAGVIESIDPADDTVYVSLTKEEIKNAPEFDEQRYLDEGYLGELGGYYGSRAEVTDRRL